MPSYPDMLVTGWTWVNGWGIGCLVRAAGMHHGRIPVANAFFVLLIVAAVLARTMAPVALLVLPLVCLSTNPPGLP